MTNKSEENPQLPDDEAAVSQKAERRQLEKDADPGATIVYTDEELAEIEKQRKVSAEEIDSQRKREEGDFTPAEKPVVIKRGAGGTRLIPESQAKSAPWRDWVDRLKQPYYLSLIGILFMVIVVGGWILSSNGDASPAPALEATDFLIVSQAGAGAVWAMDNEDNALSAAVSLPFPSRDQPLTVTNGNSLLSLHGVAHSDFRIDLSPQAAVAFTFLDEAAESVSLQILRGVVRVSGTAIVESPTGFAARVTEGKMGVVYSETPFAFDVDCFQATCKLLEVDRDLNNGDRSGIDADGGAYNPVHIRYEYYQWLPDIPAPTSTPLPTATTAPTQTTTPSSTPTSTAAPTMTPTLAATPTMTPTETISVFESSFTIDPLFTCREDSLVTYNRNDTINFKWVWEGSLTDLESNQYLELVIGAYNTYRFNDYNSGRMLDAYRQGNTWIFPVRVGEISDFYDRGQLTNEWRLQIRQENRTGRPLFIANSPRGCFRLVP